MTEPSESGRPRDEFILLQVMEDRAPSPAAIGVREITAFLVNKVPLTGPQTAYMFSNRSLMTFYSALQAELGSFFMPTVAAASSGALAERAFDGGRINRVGEPDETGGLVELLVTFDRDRVPATARDLVLVGPNSGSGRMRIAAPAPGGNSVTIYADPADPGDAAFLDVFADPMSIGHFEAVDPAATE